MKGRIVDEGSMDVVINCEECSERVAYTAYANSEYEGTYDEYRNWCLEDFEQAHECKTTNNNRYGFTVYANSFDDAERLRNYVCDALTNSHESEWDIDGDVTDYGPQEIEEEAEPS